MTTTQLDEPDIGEALVLWDAIFKEEADASRKRARSWVKAHKARYDLLLALLATHDPAEIAKALNISAPLAEALGFMAQDLTDERNIFDGMDPPPCPGKRTLLHFIIEMRANGELPPAKRQRQGGVDNDPSFQ
jgi:hypothetical protein